MKSIRIDGAFFGEQHTGVVTQEIIDLPLS